MSLSIHPAAPDHPYMHWMKKVKMRLAELQRVPNPDIRTRGEIKELKARLGLNRVPSSPAAMYNRKRSDRLKREGRCVDCTTRTRSKYARCFKCRKKAAKRSEKARELGL